MYSPSAYPFIKRAPNDVIRHSFPSWNYYLNTKTPNNSDTTPLYVHSTKFLCRPSPPGPPMSAAAPGGGGRGVPRSDKRLMEQKKTVRHVVVAFSYKTVLWPLHRGWIAQHALGRANLITRRVIR